jgi:hypothetical protein
MAGPCHDHPVPARLLSLPGVLVAAVVGGAAIVVLAVTGGQRGAVVDAALPTAPEGRPVRVAAEEPDAAVLLVVPSATAGPAAESTTAVPEPEAPSAADREAGILRRTVVPAGSGEFDVAPGSSPAPGTGEVRTVRVEVERGLPVDRGRFAAFVLATLNDGRSWAHDGAMTFARTDGDAPITVVLASPDTTARLCGPADTRGDLSCRNGPRVILTFHRWVNGTDEYAGNLTGYRQYVVNHEVGHALGRGHERCPRPGRPAPVMQQQTLGLFGCAQNPWPYP